MSFFSEFKAFAMRGNVIDLAVGVIIGGAFGKIISSLVDGIIMPVLGLILGGIDITAKTITVGHAVIKWGAFLQSVIDFTLIAFSIFLFIKLINTSSFTYFFYFIITKDCKDCIKKCQQNLTLSLRLCAPDPTKPNAISGNLRCRSDKNDCRQL